MSGTPAAFDNLWSGGVTPAAKEARGAAVAALGASDAGAIAADFCAGLAQDMDVLVIDPEAPSRCFLYQRNGPKASVGFRRAGAGPPRSIVDDFDFEVLVDGSGDAEAMALFTLYVSHYPDESVCKVRDNGGDGMVLTRLFACGMVDNKPVQVKPLTFRGTIALNGDESIEAVAIVAEE